MRGQKRAGGKAGGGMQECVATGEDRKEKKRKERIEKMTEERSCGWSGPTLGLLRRVRVAAQARGTRLGGAPLVRRRACGELRPVITIIT